MCYLSKLDFQALCSNKELYLPLNAKDTDYLSMLTRILDLYKNELKNKCQQNKINNEDMLVDLGKINEICNSIVEAIKMYCCGFPNLAYSELEKTMELLWDNKIALFSKMGPMETQQDPLILYRVAVLPKRTMCNKARLFHVPFHLRGLIPSHRYSIAGYPSLYLGTNIGLCCKEVGLRYSKKTGAVSRFAINRSCTLSMEVLEMAIKPQDFLKSKNIGNICDLPNDVIHKECYLLWYPMIAACSTIRKDKKEPFAIEYIVPQLIMQWIRNKAKERNTMLIGIRYFSCASKTASQDGYNYVFPAIASSQNQEQYSRELTQVFEYTDPLFFNSKDEIIQIEKELSKKETQKLSLNMAHE